jgi:cell division protein FtsN
MTTTPDTILFKIDSGIDGDIVDGLDFIIRMKPGDSTAILPVAPIKPVIRKDTTYMIVHEEVRELVTITEDSYAIQLGAFKRKSNADALRRRLEKLLGKKVDIVVENDFYKVRIPDLKDRAEVDEHLVILRLNGITEVWVIRLKAKQQQLVIFDKVDSIARVTETIVQQPVPISPSDMSVQVGAFRQEAYALALKNKLSSSLNNKVVIINENGYYKVRVTGFSSMQEMEKLLPSLGLLGMRDIWIIPLKRSEEQLQVVQQPVVKEPEIVKPDTTLKVIEKKVEVPVIEEKPVVPQPTIALRVGEFYKKSQADRAQRRISSRLKVPAEVVQQYDYYYILITGFYTAQETFRYYPELAALGYNKISRVEQK